MKTIENGYILIEGIPEHRIKYEKKYGKIKYGQHIHHIDHNRQNNRLSNLICVPIAVHDLIHRIHRDSGEILSRCEINVLVKRFKIKIAQSSKSRRKAIIKFWNGV